MDTLDLFTPVLVALALVVVALIVCGIDVLQTRRRKRKFREACQVRANQNRHLYSQETEDV